MGIAEGSRIGVEQIARLLADPQTPIPGLLSGAGHRPADRHGDGRRDRRPAFGT